MYNHSSITENSKANGFHWEQVSKYIPRGKYEAADEIVPDFESVARRMLEGKTTNQAYAILCELEKIAVELEKAYSLLGLLGEYFEDAKPNVDSLLMRYRMYSQLLHVVDDIVLAQMTSLDGVIEGLV